MPHEFSAPMFCLFAVLVLETTYLLYRVFSSPKKTRAGRQALEGIVAFLNALNRFSPTLDREALHKELVQLLQETMTPMGFFSRIWVANTSWQTLRGYGEHPALQSNSAHHLPVAACPAYQMKKPFRYQKTEGHPCQSERFNYSRHLCLPIIYEEESFGVLFVGSYAAGEWTVEENHLFTLITQAIALTLQRRNAFERLQEKIEELKFSFEVGATAMATFFGSTQSLEETTFHLLDGVQSILKVDRSSLMIWDAQQGQLRTQWVRGEHSSIRSPMALAMGEGMAGWALKTGQPYGAEYAMGDPHYKATAQPIQSLLCVPMFTMDRQPLGVINAVTTKKPRHFEEREVRFLSTFAHQAAMAIENAQLHQRNRSNIDQLSELNKMKSQFLSLVSHDLRGPLTGIRGFCEVLKEENVGALNDTQRELLDQMEKQVDHQERMVDDLLDFARMEKGQLSIHPTLASLSVLLREEVEKSTREAKERGLQLALVLPHTPLPEVCIDEGRIRQVVWNLIHNALKFTPEGGRVTVRAQKLEAAIRVDVEDSGVGLSTETQQKIFEKFFQVTPGGSRGAQGLGLGLAICREIILSHQGEIVAQSPGLGLGTTISFRLPLPQSLAKAA